MPASKKATKKKAGKIARPKKHARTGKAKSRAVSAQERQRMISEAAYFIAEQRHFRPGSELDDWLLAEAQIDNDSGR